MYTGRRERASGNMKNIYRLVKRFRSTKHWGYTMRALLATTLWKSLSNQSSQLPSRGLESWRSSSTLISKTKK